jgi:hypothetical protein
LNLDTCGASSFLFGLISTFSGYRYCMLCSSDEFSSWIISSLSSSAGGMAGTSSVIFRYISRLSSASWIGYCREFFFSSEGLDPPSPELFFYREG